MMFRSYNNTSEYFFKDYVAIAMAIISQQLVIFTCEDIMLFSCVKISCLRVKAHLVFHWSLYNKQTYLDVQTYRHTDRPTDFHKP